MRASSGGFRVWQSVSPAWARDPTAVPFVLGVYLQLSLEDHNQGREGDAHGHTVGQAQEERGEEADHPDTL